MPLRALEEVDEVDAERLICLPQLPVFSAAVPFQFLAEPSHLIGEGLIGGRSRQKPSYPAHEVRRRRRAYQLGLEQELAELLQGRLELTHGFTSPPQRSRGMPQLRLRGTSFPTTHYGMQRYEAPAFGVNLG
jgi:hypothetical protein